MKLRSGLIALTGLAVASLYGTSAMAQGSVSLSKTYSEGVTTTVTNNINIDLSKAVDVSKDLTLSGLVGITGSIEVTESAMATVDNKQILDDNNVSGGNAVNNDSSVGENVLANATGNIGLNVAAGDNNAQDNATAMAAVGATAAGASSDAEIFVYQESYNNSWSGASNQINNSELLGAVLSGASGNIGVNVASGAYNVQKNALTVAAVTGEAVLAEASAAVVQQASFNTVSHGDTQNSSSLAGDVLNAASGNIGTNVAAGTNNIQANSLSMSTVN